MRNTINYALPQFDNSDLFTKEDINDAFEKIDRHMDALQFTLNDTQTGGAITIQEVVNARGVNNTLGDRLVATDTSISDIMVNVYNELQTAIDTVESNRTLNIIGTKTLTNPLTLKDGVKITGNGTIVFNTSYDYLIDLSNLSNVTIDGITIIINGDDVSNYSNALFKLYNSKNITIKNCKITCINRTIFNFAGTGEGQRSENITIRDNDLTTIGTTIQSSPYSYIVFSAQRSDIGTITTKGNRNVRFFNNYISNSKLGCCFDFDNSTVYNNTFYLIDSPISCLKVKNSSFLNNNIKGFISNGLCLGNGSDDLLLSVVCSGNILDGKDEDGTQKSLVNGINIYKQGGDGDPLGAEHPNIKMSKKIAITNNTIRNCGANGIFAYGNGNSTISGNVCTDNLGGGISIAGGGGDNGTHPGNVTVSNNYCKDNGSTGINVGDSTTSVPRVTVANNISVENGRGMYISKCTKSVISNNIISNNRQYGFMISNVTDCTISNNRIEDNITSGSDPEGYLGNIVLNVSTTNNIKFDNNVISALNNIHYINQNMPTYRKGNQGFPNAQGVFIEKDYEVTGTSQTVAKNIDLPYTGSWYSGQILVSVSSSRSGSSNLYAHHQNCLAIVNVVRLTTTISIGEIKYIHQNQATDPTNGNANVPQATISVSINADNNSIDITGNSNYASTDNIVMTISPMRSCLFKNSSY